MQLETTRVGGTLCTTAQAVDRFLTDRPLAAVRSQAGAALAVLPRIAERQARWATAELAAVWSALGRYSARRLGVPPEVLLESRGFRSLPGEVATALGRYPNVTADPGYGDEYLEMLELCWATRFGQDDVE